MQEKVIITGVKKDNRSEKIIRKAGIIMIAVSVSLFIILFFLGPHIFKADGFEIGGHSKAYYFFYTFFNDFLGVQKGVFLVLLVYLFRTGVIAVIISFIIKAIMDRSDMTVTDERVFGTASFGKKAVIPIDQICYVGYGICSSIVIGVPSGKIYFWLVLNRKDVSSSIYEIMRKMRYE